MVPNGETFGTINVNALREAAVGSEKKRRKGYLSFCGVGGQIRHFCTI